MSKEFEVKVGMHQGSVLSPFPFVIVIYVVTELATNGVQVANGIVLMSETIEGLSNKLKKLKKAIESNSLKDNHGKINVILIRSITKDGLSERLLITLLMLDL